MVRVGNARRGALAAAAGLCLAVAAPAAAAEQPAPATAPAPPSGEAPPPSPPALLRAVPFTELPGWASDGHAEILPPLLAGCAAMRPMRPDAALGGQGIAADRAGRPADWQSVCADLRALQRALPRPPRPGRGRTQERRVAAWLAARHLMVREFIEARFDAFAAGTGLMTGYYEPVLRGAPAAGEEFRTPLYARPPELVEQPVPGNPLRRRFGMMREGRFEPFFDRAAIEHGALAGQGLELVWLDDPVDAFFLHIQGSGRVRMPDGSVLRVGYAAQNGQPYRSIGRVLIEGNEIAPERMSMQALRDWLRAAGPERTAEVLGTNPSFVFFRRVEGLSLDQGPIGAMGVPLTPQRSVAVDRAFIPLGAPMFVTVRDPHARRGAPPAGRLVVAQDTGGAIRGPARTDYFWGWGAEAGDLAGRMRDDSEVFLLLPRPIEMAAAPAEAEPR